MAELVPLLSAEENNEISWYTAGAAGIASGVLKVPEGIVSLAAELIDLGADTKTAIEVENPHPNFQHQSKADICFTCSLKV